MPGVMPLCAARHFLEMKVSNELDLLRQPKLFKYSVVHVSKDQDSIISSQNQTQEVVFVATGKV